MELKNWLVEFAGPEALAGGLSGDPTDKLHLLKYYQGQDEQQRLKMRAATLNRIQSELADEQFKEEVRAALGFDVEMKSWKKKKSTVEETGDYRKTFDIVDDEGKFQAMTLQQAEKISQGAPRLFALKDYMRKTRCKWTEKLDDEDQPVRIDKPLFDDADIRRDLFTPLVREGIVGDTFLIDPYSEVQQTIDQTNQLYMQDLSTPDKFQGLNFALELGDLGGKLVTETVGAVVAGVVPKGTEGRTTGVLVQSIVGLVSTGVTTTKEVVAGLTAAQYAGSLDRGLGGLASIVGGAIRLAIPGGNGTTISKIVESGIKVAGGGAKLGKSVETMVTKYKETGRVDSSSFIEGVGQILESSFTIAGTATSSDNKELGTALKEAGRYIGKSFRTTAKGSNVIETVVVKVMKGGGRLGPGDLADILNELGKLAGQAVKEFALVPLENHRKDALKTIGNNEKALRLRELQAKSSLSTEEQEEMQGLVDDGVVALTDQKVTDLLGGLKLSDEQREANAYRSEALSDEDALRQGLKERRTALGALGKSQSSTTGDVGPSFGDLMKNVTGLVESGRTKKKLDEQLHGLEIQSLRETYGLDGQTAEEELKQATKDLDQEREEHRKTIELLAAGGDPGYDALAKLVAKYKTRKAVWNTLTSVGQAGTAIAQQFCSAMAIAGTLIKFAKEAALVFEHSVAIHKWKSSRGWARASASAYLSSLDAEVRELAEQITHHTIQSAMLMLKVIGQIVQVAGTAAQGIGAVVGEVISRSASATQIAEEIIYRIVRKAEVIAAWKKTKKALENPSNRRLGLQVRAMNATLAKYTLAYGAFVVKDSVVRMTLAKFGIDDKTLETAEDGMPQVRKALEELFSEDKTVKGKAPYRVGWSKGLKIDLTVSSWFAAWSKGVTLGRLASEPAPDHVRDAFQNLLVRATALKANPDDQEEQGNYQGALFQLETKLDNWSPRMATDMRHVHTEMDSVRESFLDEVAKARGLAPALPPCFA